MSLEELINAAVNRDGREGGESTIVSVDLRQKTEFSVRGGNVEFFPNQDDEHDTRKKFIAKIFKDNQLSQRLEYCMALYLTKGEILWLVFPNDDDKYLIEFFHGGETDPDPEYKVYYKSGGRKIDSVIITYPYKTMAEIGGFEVERWVKLHITEEWIDQSDLSSKPSLSNLNPTAGMMGYEGYSQVQKYPNPFAPTIPIVLCANNPRRAGQKGTSDYHWMKSQIESHERMVSQIKRNLRFFGNPTLVTTRSPTEVTEAADRGLHTPTWASQQGYIDGFGDAYSSSSRVADPLTRRAPGYGGADAERIAQVIGGVAQDERFGYIVPDPVTGDLNQFQRQERELIHYALGGIDPLGISSGATAFEVKTLFGRVENTADGKADGLYTHGLALVFEQILYFEEQLFKQSLFQAMKSVDGRKWKKLQDPSQLADDICQQLMDAYQQGQIQLAFEPDGMLPMGDRTVNWRYTRPVFKNSTREMLDLSIASRNAREDGLSQEYCLRMQHPDMTDKEIQDVMAGFSPRVVENASNSIQTLIQLYQQFMQTPDPQNPSMPWGIRLGIGDMLDQALLTLQKELQYGQPVYDPAESSPSINDPAARIRIPGGSSAAPTTGFVTSAIQPAPNNPTNATYGLLDPSSAMVAYGLPTTSPIPTEQPASGYSQSGRFSQGEGQPPIIPAPGATVTQQGGSVFGTGYGSSGESATPSIPAGIPAEFISNPYLWSLYSNIPGNDNTSSSSGRKSKRK